MKIIFLWRGKLVVAIVLCAAFAANIIAQEPAARVVPATYVSDGCSMFPDGDYCECCVAHDKVYYFGGSKAERKAADDKLYECVLTKGHKFIAPMMWLGVRVGGVGFLPTTFRWGFGLNARKEKIKSPETVSGR
ncbi:hypothetical protein BH10ACI3_BH10ACI3_10620 [soil metagenome]